MATTYKDIKRQIADLEKKAADARKAEVAKVIAGMKSQIAEYELTVADLFGAAHRAGVKAAKSAAPAKAPKPPRYMDPKTGKTWSGMGKAPGWIAAAVKKGKKEDFLIAKVEALRAAKANAKAAAPAKSAKANAAPSAAAKKTAAAKPAAKGATVKAAVAKKAAAPQKAAGKPAGAKTTKPVKKDVIPAAETPSTTPAAAEAPAA